MDSYTKAQPYLYIFGELVDRYWWCKSDAEAIRRAERWKSLFYTKFLLSQPEGSMARVIVRDAKAAVQVRRDKADSAGIISCEPVVLLASILR